MLVENRAVSVRSVLVVGGAIAGSTLAYWLGRQGIATTVVELAQAQRSSGSPVDVRGLATNVVQQMNLLQLLQEAATQVTRLVVVDAHGRPIGWIPTQGSAGGLEVPRRDLSAILADAARDYAEYLYDESITAVNDDGSGVEVTFERAKPGRFDVVVGADGLHSRVRRLTFGPEEQFMTHLGMYIATTELHRPAADLHSVFMHNAPGRAVAIHPTTGQEGAAFIFRHPRLPADVARDPQQRERLLTDVYRDLGWRVPELLERFRTSNDVYFDAVSRVRLDAWSRGRRILVGDAASCVSLLGEGSSMAIIGAATLAQSLTSHPNDLDTAFRRYEQIHRPRLRRRHRGVAITSHLLVPASRLGTAGRNSAFRTWAAIAAGQRRLARASTW
jgi:2-polyprenyl-6-methoxyphenol hydroxylase-like FAD-dependent oxidoreductase